jgi:Zn-dependent protease with chaperone function
MNPLASPSRFDARGFDGRESVVRHGQVELVVDGNATTDAPCLRWVGSLEAPYPATDAWPLHRLSFSERFAAAPRRVSTPDGWTWEIDDPDGGFHAALQAAGQRSRGVAHWLEMRRSGWASALALVVLVLLIDQWALGWAAGRVAQVLPIAATQTLSAGALRHLDAEVLRPSAVPVARREVLGARWAELAQAHAPNVPMKLRFHDASDHSWRFNAFALPDGTIVLLDGLTLALDDDEVIAVLAHELGHVAHQHGMTQLLRGVGIVTVGGVVLGDLSGLSAAAAMGLRASAFGRDAEREADAYARRFLVETGLGTEAWARALRKLQGLHGRSAPGWLTSHPTTDERLRDAHQPAR